MTERVTTVKLALDLQGFKTSLASAKTQVKDFAGQVKTSASQQKEAWNTVGTAQAAMGAGLLAAFATIVKTTAQFDKSMSNVKADLQVSTGELGKLRDAAIEAGAKTVFSASESADAIDELGKAGVSTSDILSGALNASLSLASAGGLGVADAATIAASTLTQFGLKGTDASHIADLLAAGAGKAQGSVQDLGAALGNVGTVASNTGLSVDETTGFLAAMASYGLTGAEAGTQLKSMLQSLQGPSSTAKKAMQELGLSLYDNSGKTKSLTQFVGEYQASLKGKTQAEKDSYNTTIFGSYGIQAATVAYKEGATGIQSWIDKVDDAGYAAKVASQKMDNLAGDWENFTGALDTALIVSGSSSNDMLRKLTQGATDVVNAYDSMPSSIQNTLGIFTALAAVVGIANAAFLLGIPRVVAYREALAQMGTATKVTGGALKTLGKVTGVVGIAVVAFEGFNAVLEAGAASAGDWQNALESGASAAKLLGLATQQSDIKAFFGGDYAAQYANLGKLLDTAKSAKDALGDTFGGLNLTLNESSAMTGLNNLGDQLAVLAGSDLPAATAEFKKLATAQNLTSDQQQTLLEAMGPGFSDALKSAAGGSGLLVDQSNILAVAMGDIAVGASATTTTTQKFSTSIDTLGASTQDASGDMDTLAKKIENYNSVVFDSMDSQIGMEQAIDDATKALKKNGDTATKSGHALDISTQKGRDNKSALIALASAANKAAADQYLLTNSTSKVKKTLDDGRSSFVKTAQGMGLTKSAAKDLADQLFAVPSVIETQANVTGVDAAIGEVNSLKKVLERFGKGATHEAINVDIALASRAGNSQIPKVKQKDGHADGGAIRGAGTATSDSVPAMLSTGEHVLTASDVAAMGGQDGVYAFRASLHSFAVGGASDATLKKRLAHAKHAEAVAQKHYDSISGDKKHKAAKAAANAKLKAAEKKADKAQDDWDARKTANAGYTDYVSDRRTQASDISYDKSVAAKMPHTAAGQKLAQQYLDDASSTAIQGASDNVAALRKVVADPNASRAVKAKARKQIKSQQAKLTKLQLEDLQKQSDANYTDYLADVRSQKSDVKYDKSVASKMPKTALGKKLAQQYSDAASSAALQAASDNVDALRKIVNDPTASKGVRAKAAAQLKTQQANLTKLQIADLQKQADANYTNYLDGLKTQSADVKYDQSMAKTFTSSTAIGKQMAKQYNDAAMSAALSAAESNIDTLRSVIADPATSAATRAKAKAQLKTQQTNLTNLQYKQSALDLRDAYQDAFDQTKDSIASSLKTIDLTSKASTTTTYDKKKNADGSVSISTRSNTGYTASGIDSYFSTKAADNKRFGGKLKKLSGKIPSELLEYIASQGVAGGEPMADALLSASSSQLKSIAANYTASGAAADAVGTTVATAEYGPRIDALNKAIADGSDAIVKELSKGIKVVPNANGGIHAYADGGIPTGMYSGSQGPIYKFAEPSTRWEAFVSGKPGQEARNRRILSQAASRLGMVAFEDGGFTGYGRPRRDGAAAVSVVSGVAPVTVSMEGMAVYVENPFTGQQVRASVARVAKAEIASAQHEREVRA